VQEMFMFDSKIKVESMPFFYKEISKEKKIKTNNDKNQNDIFL
jgi:hypothetical protein